MVLRAEINATKKIKTWRLKGNLLIDMKDKIDLFRTWQLDVATCMGDILNFIDCQACLSFSCNFMGFFPVINVLLKW